MPRLTRLASVIRQILLADLSHRRLAATRPEDPRRKGQLYRPWPSVGRCRIRERGYARRERPLRQSIICWKLQACWFLQTYTYMSSSDVRFHRRPSSPGSIDLPRATVSMHSAGSASFYFGSSECLWTIKNQLAPTNLVLGLERVSMRLYKGELYCV